MEYASLVGSTLPETATESVVSSVETAVTWTQDNFKKLELSARQLKSVYSDAATSFEEFSTGLTKCIGSVDAAEKAFRQAIRKLLAAGVDVNPHCEPANRTPMIPELITDPILVRDQATSLFALKGEISRIQSSFEVFNHFLVVKRISIVVLAYQKIGIRFI